MMLGFGCFVVGFVLALNRRSMPAAVALFLLGALMFAAVFTRHG